MTQETHEPVTSRPPIAGSHELAYRPDIDGLRALAVIAVILFHARLPGFGGGFVGVDVFFVVSGYLISGIIIRAIERGRFSFREFYSRRINRIFPALIVILLSTFALGWYLLFRHEFFSLGKHIAAGAGFSSNFALMDEIGYFDVAAEKKPLLHLWSLAIEEQFYLVWPVLLAVSWRIRARFIWFAVLTGLVSCFFGFAFAFTQHAATSFFLPFTRLWELVAGFCLLYFELPPNSDSRFSARSSWLPKVNLSADRLANIRAWVGILLIGCSVYFLNSRMAWPSLWTIAPVLGTVLVVSGGAKSWLSQHVFSKPLAVGIGLISYPLYLWHWPLLSFSRFVQPQHTSPVLITAAIAVSFVLAFITYKFVEYPIRSRTENRGRRALVLLAIMAFVAALGAIAWRGLITPRLDTPRIREVEAAIQDWTYPGGGFGDNGSIRPWSIVGNPHDTVFFAGDSHMEQYWARAEYVVRNSNASAPTAIFLTAGGCPMLPHAGRTDSRQCDRFYEHAMQRIKNSGARAVAIGTFWEQLFRRNILFREGDRSKRPLSIDEPATDSIFSEFESDIRALTESGKRVYVLLSIPIYPSGEFDPHMWLPNRLHPLRDTVMQRGASRAEFVARVRSVSDRVRASAVRGGAVVLDPVDYLCGTATCPNSDSLGNPLYRDDVHLRARTARERATFIDEVFFGKPGRR